MTKQIIRGRIIKSLGGFYYVADSEDKENIIECRARGAFRQQNLKPCVGDWAEVELTPQMVIVLPPETTWPARILWYAARAMENGLTPG